jgi:hypothetical protein
MATPVTPQVTARLHLLVSEWGPGERTLPGRGLPITLHSGDEYFTALVETLDGSNLLPGATTSVSVEFLLGEAALPSFRVGSQFTVWDGKDIGHGEVLSVVGTSNKSLERTREG